MVFHNLMYQMGGESKNRKLNKHHGRRGFGETQRELRQEHTDKVRVWRRNSTR